MATGKAEIGDGGDAGTELVDDARLRSAIALQQPPQQLQGRTLVLGLPLPDAMPIDLELTRVSPFAEGARVILMTAEGERDLPLPDVAVFKGNVAGDPQSRVFISMHDGVSNGYVRVDDRTYIIAPDPDQPGRAAIYNEEILANVEGNDADADGENQAPPTSCLTEPGHFTWALPEVEDQSFSLRNDPPCRELTIAIDTDTEFSQRFGFNDNNASAYAATLMSAVSEIYEEDLNISLVVSTIRLWDQGVNDPYPTNNGSTSHKRWVIAWVKANLSITWGWPFGL